MKLTPFEMMALKQVAALRWWSYKESGNKQRRRKIITKISTNLKQK